MHHKSVPGGECDMCTLELTVWVTGSFAMFCYVLGMSKVIWDAPMFLWAAN